MKDLKKLTKKELIDRLCATYANVKHQEARTTQKTIQIRHFRVRLMKIRNSIDYLLKHPYSVDNSYRTKKHTRDCPQKMKR